MKGFLNISLTLLSSVFVFSSCLSSGDDTIVLESGTSSGIPSDDLASENPIIKNTTTYIPNPSYEVETSGNDAIVSLDMTGIQNSSTYDWLHLVGTSKGGQNVWVSVDDHPKGIHVSNNSDDENKKSMVADLVFLIDNSGSMDEEADVIARDIISWSKKLEDSRLDIRFGCVGYSEYGTINGAINITDAESLSTYLNRSYGTNRTVGFSGTDASKLKEAASSYRVSDECGGLALRYADSNISFRSKSNRIYVNFTDEPNQPNGNSDYSINYFNNQSNWPVSKGTVHTVFSSDTTYFRERPLYDEKPWRISQYTGGTTIVTSSSFSNVTLESLPVTGAMQNSYTIRFTNVKEYMDGKPHSVKITILSADGLTRAEKIFNIVFGTSNKV